MRKLDRQRVGNTRPVVAMSALAAAISACYIPQSAVAQGAQRIEEVVVTVRRRVEMEQDVPIAMKVMDSDFLRNQNIGQVQDLGIKVPSMRISQAGGSQNEPLISLRGQRPAESVFNQDPAVPMYFNEVAISPTQGSNLGLYDLESLQVLKGPQGTLFGRNSTGGAVLMTPKRPGNELGGYAELKVGDYDLWGFEGAVDMPINENWQVRLAGRKLDRGGYQENIANNALNGKEYNDEHSEAARLSINFDGERLSNLLVLAQDENRLATPVISVTGVVTQVSVIGLMPDYVAGVQRNIARDDPWKIESDVDGEEQVRNVFVSDTVEFEFTDDFAIKNILAYRKVDFETSQDIDGTAFPGWGAITTGAITLDPRPSNQLQSEFISNEFQLLGSAFDQKLDWITGFYWSKLDATQNQAVQQVPAVPPFVPAPRYDITDATAVNTSYGVFVEGTYTFSDEWSLTTGVRQSWDERELTLSKWNNLARTNCQITGPGGASLPNCTRTVEETFDSPTGRVSLNFTPIAGHLVYGSISTGYRAGGFNTRGTNDQTLAPFDPEKVLTYEAGHKADWDLSWAALRTSAAVYFQQYEDIHYTQGVPAAGGIGIATVTKNAAEAEITGFELDVTLLPVDDLELGLSYSYVDAQFKERTDLINGQTIDTSGNDFVYIPEQSLTASATYTLPLDPDLGDISFNVNVYWQDDMNTAPLYEQFSLRGWNAENLARARDFSTVDSYEVWNARIDWRGVMQSGFDVAVYVNNATDEQYAMGGLNVLDSGGYGGYHYGAPRTVGASVRYTF